MQIDAGTVAAVLSLDVGDFSKGINSAKAMMRTFESDTTSAAQKMRAMGDTIAGIGKSLTYTVTAGVTAAGGLALNTYSTFEDAMLQVKAISGAAQDEYALLTEAAQRAGGTTRFTAAEAANALNYMAMAGWKTEEMLGGLDGVLSLAAASGADLAATSDIVTDALTAMGYEASDAARLADVMAAASANANTNVNLMGYTFKYAAAVCGTLGYSMEDLAVATGMMANAGIKGEMAGTQLRAGMLRMTNPTKEMTELMERYGITITNADGSAKSLMDVMNMYRDRLGGLTQAEKAQAAAVLFGQEAAAGWLSIINAGQEDFDKLTQAVHNSKDAANAMAATMESGVGGAVREMRSAAQNAAIEFGEVLAPMAIKGAEAVTGLMRSFSNLDDETKQTATGVALAAAAIGPATTVIGKAIRGLSSPVGMATVAVAALGAGYVWLKKLFYDASAEGIAEKFRASIDPQIAENVKAGLEAELTDIDTLGTGLAARVPSLYTTIFDAFVDGKEDTREMLDQLEADAHAFYADAIQAVNEGAEAQIANLDPQSAAYAENVQAIRDNADATIQSLKGTEAETVAWIESMAGQSAEYVRAHAGELDAIKAKADETTAAIDAAYAAEYSRGANAYATARAGASQDAATYGLAANWALNAYRQDTEAARAQGEADMAALQESYARGMLDEAQYTLREGELLAGQEAEIGRIKALYQGRMMDVLTGAAQAYAQPEEAKILTDYAQKSAERDQWQAALDSVSRTGLVSADFAKDIRGQIRESLRLYDWLFDTSTAENLGYDAAWQLGEAEAGYVAEGLRNRIGELEAQIPDIMSELQGSDGLGIIQTILDSEAGAAMEADTSTMGEVVRAAFAGIGEAGKEGMAQGMEDDGKIAEAGAAIGGAAADATRQALGIHSPSRIYFGIGQNTIRSMILGAAGEEGALQRQMRSMVRSAVAAMRQEASAQFAAGIFQERMGQGFSLGLGDESVRASYGAQNAAAGGGTNNNYTAPTYNITIPNATIRSESEAASIMRDVAKRTTAMQRGYGKQ